MTAPSARARDALARCPTLDIAPSIPTTAGWRSAAELLDPTHLESALEAMHGRWSTPDRRVDGAFLTGHYAWFLGLAAAGPWFADEVLLDLHPEAIAFHDAGGGLDAVAVDGDRPVRPATLEALADGLERHTDALVAAMRAATPLGERAIRALAGDGLAGALQWAGQAAGTETRALDTARSILARPAWRWRGGFVMVEDGTDRACVQERGSCCLSYRLDGDDRCDTCPLRPPEDRRARVVASLRDARGLD